MNRLQFIFLFTLGTLLFFIAPSARLLCAEGPDQQKRFIDGNQAFEKGELQQAEDFYISLIQQDFKGAALYYNVGNL
jgi:hypothetical protein